jgi:predicted small lipoprotein YifL
LCLTPFILISILLLILTGCGKKGPVRPKLATLPSAPTDVALHQQGNFFVLEWDVPATNKDGSAATDLSGFSIRRLTYSGEDGCPTCREPQLQVAEIDLRYPEPAQQIGARLYWRDLDIRPGNGYRYAITPLTVGELEGSVATIHLSVMQPPPAPTNLKVKAGDAQVSLQWEAPALAPGMTLVGYNLYRRQAKRIYPIVPINIEPLENTQILDRGLDNGRAYEYRVSALVRSGEQVLESMASPAALITPQKGR